MTETELKVALKLEMHEKVCSERYKDIFRRLKRIEGWIFTAVASILGLLVTILLRGNGLL